MNIRLCLPERKCFDMQMKSRRSENFKHLHGVFGVDDRNQTMKSRMNQKDAIEEKKENQPVGHQRGHSN